MSLGASRGFAGSAAWSGATDAAWSNANNWLPASAPGSLNTTNNTDTATFNSAGNGNTIITVDSGRNVQNIIFDSASAAAYTFNGGSLSGTAGGQILMTPTVVTSQTFNSPLKLVGTGFSLTNNASASSAVLDYAGSVSGGSITLAGSNTGNNTLGVSSAIVTGLTKTGTGTWLIASSVPSALQNSGVTTINQGTLRIGTTNELSTTTPLLVTGGALDLNGFSQTVFTLKSYATPQSNPPPPSSGAVINSQNASPVTLTIRGNGTDDGDNVSFSGSIGAPGANNIALNNDPGPTRATVFSGSNTYTGPTTLTSGYLILEYASDGSAPSSNVISPLSSLVDGATLNFTAANSGASQSFNGLTLIPGSAAMSIGTNGGAMTVNFGAITRNVGATLDLDVQNNAGPSSGYTTSAPNTNGIVGGYLTLNGTDWAVSNGAGNLITPATYTNDTWSPGANVAVTTNSTQTGATANSLRFAASSSPVTVTLSGTCVLSSGGILVTGAVGTKQDKITGGTLEGAAGADLIVNTPSAPTFFQISSTIADNTSATALTKSGPGSLLLSGANTYSGPTYINGGILEINSNANLGSPAAGAAIDINGGSLYVVNSISLDNAGTNPRPIAVNGNGGTIRAFSGGSQTLTIPGIISGSADGGLTLGNGGNVLLTAANTFSGVITFQDTLELGNSNAVQNATVNPDTSFGGGAGVLSFISGIGNFNFGGLSGNGFINLQDTASQPVALKAGSNGSSTIFTGQFGGSGSLTKVGPGTLTLTSTSQIGGPLHVNAGTLTLGTAPSSQTVKSPSITVAAGATLNANASLNNSPAASLTVDGTVNFGSGSGGIVNRTFGPVTIHAGGSVTIAPRFLGAGTQTVLSASSFSNAGLLDLGYNDMIIQNADFGDVFNQLKSGFNSGGSYWNGATGIISSGASADTRFQTTLGYRSGGIPFDGVNTTSADALVKYTYYGDADLNGTLNGADYQQIDKGFGLHLSGWSNGDFNYDGVVNGLDYALIDSTFNQIAATGAAPSLEANPSDLPLAANVTSVPEPGSLAMMVIATAFLARRSRKNLTTFA